MNHLRKQATVMSHPANDPGEWAKASAAARRAVTGLARDRGAQLTSRAISPGSDVTVRDLESLEGARAARDIELAARHAARGYIRTAREAGHGWEQIGRALGVVPGGDADQAGLTIAEAAYTYAAGRPDTAAPWRPRAFHWRCQSCDRVISDHGPIANPAEDEIGHTGDCPRLAASVAQWDAGWEAEP